MDVSHVVKVANEKMRTKTRLPDKTSEMIFSHCFSVGILTHNLKGFELDVVLTNPNDGTLWCNTHSRYQFSSSNLSGCSLSACNEPDKLA